jgi:hypothetical protein
LYGWGYHTDPNNIKSLPANGDVPIEETVVSYTCENPKVKNNSNGMDSATVFMNVPNLVQHEQFETKHHLSKTTFALSAINKAIP